MPKSIILLGLLLSFGYINAQDDSLAGSFFTGKYSIHNLFYDPEHRIKTKKRLDNLYSIVRSLTLPKHALILIY